jgi:hypothetical protein
LLEKLSSVPEVVADSYCTKILPHEGQKYAAIKVEFQAGSMLK